MAKETQVNTLVERPPLEEMLYRTVAEMVARAAVDELCDMEAALADGDFADLAGGGRRAGSIGFVA
ncbi:MAG: hypothetical protein IKF96_04335 [Eggerthellaceae bacterium]|nr:hypothetical protein [Eggerthellaceae bacterium]